MTIYFVSYSYKKGFGNCEVEIKPKIRDFSDLNEIRDKLEKEGASNVVIINFIKLERKEKQEEKK